MTATRQFVPVPTTANNGKSPIIAGGQYVLQKPIVPGRTFYASQYSPHNDLVTSDLPAIQAAINACVSAGGGIVILDAADWLLNTAGSPYLTFPADMGYHIVIQGLGKFTTNVRLGPSTRTFIAPDGVLTGNTHTYKNLTVQDLTVNGRNTNGTDLPSNNLFGALFGTAIKANYSDLTFRNVDTVAMGPNIGTGHTTTGGAGAPTGVAITQERRNIDLTIATTPEGFGGTSAYTIKRITVDNCTFGRTGGGGNCGVIISAFYGGADKVISKIWNAPWISNVWAEDILYRDSTYDSGTTPTSTTSAGSGIGGVGFMVGQALQGTRWTAIRCKAYRSPDPGFEFDSCLDLKVIDCYAEDNWNVGFYFTNIGGGADTFGEANREQHIQVRGCTAARRTLGILAADGAPCQPFLFNQARFATPQGKISLIDCNAVSKLAGLPTLGSPAVEFRGNARKITIRNLHIDEEYTTSESPAGTGVTGCKISLMGGRGIIDIDGIHHDAVVTSSGGGNFVLTALALDMCNDHALKIKGIHPHYYHTRSGTTNLTSRIVQMGVSSGVSSSQAFSNSGDQLHQNGVWDAGTGTDMVQTGNGGVVKAAANTTSEFRWIWMMEPGTSWLNIGPFTDGCLSIKHTPGATITGYKGGVMLKRQVKDATTYLDAYVKDDGTSSKLYIDKVIAGSRTNLTTSSALSTRISNGVAFWVRAQIRGNLVTADYFTSAGSIGTVTTGGEETITATLTGADIKSVGEAVQGWAGFTWIPQGTDASIDDARYDRMMVLSGVIQDVTPVELVTMSEVDGINFNVSAGRWRHPSKLVVNNCDFSKAEGATTLKDFLFTDTAEQTSITTQNIGYSSTTLAAAGAITVTTSPFTYSNPNWFRERVGVIGGTVSIVSVTDVAGTTTQLAAASNTSVTLDPGESIVVTYSSAPTMNRVPIR